MSFHFQAIHGLAASKKIGGSRSANCPTNPICMSKKRINDDQLLDFGVPYFQKKKVSC
jgi:hypothetical protein